MKQVIVLRKDLGMNKGKMIAQGAHAAMMCLIDGNWYSRPLSSSKEIWDWTHGNMAKIVVGVDSLKELEELEEAARKAELRVHSVIDSGKTVPACEGQKTCIAIGPNEDAEIDKVTGHLKLL